MSSTFESSQKNGFVGTAVQTKPFELYNTRELLVKCRSVDLNLHLHFSNDVTHCKQKNQKNLKIISSFSDALKQHLPERNQRATCLWAQG